MEANLRPSSSVSSRMSTIDVGQLDKINAIPNKTTDNVLLDGLCIEDQLYMGTLMDEDSTDSDTDRPPGSPWSPAMVERPMGLSMNMNGQKRIKMKMKPQYAITMSLEDISYIRPSWKMSKGVKRTDASKQPRSKRLGSSRIGELEKEVEENKLKDKPLVTAYHVLLALLMVVVIVFMVLAYVVDLNRHRERVHRFRLEMRAGERSFTIYKEQDGEIVKHFGLRVSYGRGIPANLRHEQCGCESFEAELVKHLGRERNVTWPRSGQGHCFACADWAHRANMRLLVNKFQPTRNLAEHEHSGVAQEDLAVTCYDIKWQSYDTLATPLVDCFEMSPDEQWFGLGDVHWPLWSVDQIQQDQFVPLQANLAPEFSYTAHPLAHFTAQTPARNNGLNFGSYVDLSLISSSGFFIGNLRTDFQASISISSERREICLVVACADKCTRMWSRRSHQEQAGRLDGLEHQNNLFEYSVCSASSWRQLSSRLIDERTQRLMSGMPASGATRGGGGSSESAVAEPADRGALETLQAGKAAQEAATTTTNRTDSTPPGAREPIGLMERTIFKTSAEYIATLDGQTLRQHVDKIVKLNLKTSPILLIDTRWQSYLGSFKLDWALFPKAKLLFEILHTKGFKILLTVKPYIDAKIGLPILNQLLEQERLVSAQYDTWPMSSAGGGGDGGQLGVRPVGAANSSATVTRRKSFFLFQNETVWFREQLERQRTGLARPKAYMFDCKDSSTGQCLLVQVATGAGRAWLVDLIRRSSFLSQEADGILLAGAHPDAHQWEAHYRRAMFQLAEQLFYAERLLVLPQWTGNFNYVELGARPRTWPALESLVSSVLNLGLQGFALVHPGSVWGDLRAETAAGASAEDDAQAEEELVVRWLQVAVFLPVLQFNDLAPIERFGLHEQLQNLVRIRKLSVVPEMRKHVAFTPLLWRDLAHFKLQRRAASQQEQQLRQPQPQLAALRHTWNTNTLATLSEPARAPVNEAPPHQFMIGDQLLVAPILAPGQRQRDIYLPAGIWHDELRKANIRGGKWLRNYPVELNEIAWFTRARR